MPTRLINDDMIAPVGVAYALNADGWSIIVLPGVTVMSVADSALAGMYLQGASNQVHMAGQLIGRVAFQGTTTAVGLRLTIAETGTVVGGSTGLFLEGDTFRVLNQGMIDATLYGILATGENGSFVNRGTVTATFSYSGSFGVDSVANAGLMVGDVLLGSGDDSFDGAGGSVLGAVDLGEGNDLGRGGAGSDLFQDGGGQDSVLAGAGDDTLVAAPDQVQDDYDGGAGIDRLDLRFAVSGARVDLVDGVLRGEFGGDFVVGFEQVIGSEGADRMIGSDLAETLRGGDGDDTLLGGGGNDLLDQGVFGSGTLDGGAGNDRLIGGSFRDTLTGGTGRDVLYGAYDIDRMFGGAEADRFVWRDIDELFLVTPGAGTSDRISDFEVALDVIDLSAVDLDPGTAQDEAFTFVGTGPITAPGQVAIRTAGGNTWVDIAFFTAGPAGSIRLDGLLTLTAANFEL